MLFNVINSIQSAFARHVLDTQLGAVALFDPSEGGKTDLDVVFNDSMFLINIDPFAVHLLSNSVGE